MNKRFAVAMAILCMLVTTVPNKAGGQVTGDNMGLATLNAIIKAPGENRDAKSRAVFDLFSNYLQMPATAADAAQVFLERSWIDSAGIQVPRGIFGSIPVTWANGETLYVIYLYPHPDGWSEYVIYLTVTGAQLDKSDLVRLLKGQPDQTDGATSWRALGISEVALCGFEKNDSNCRRLPETPTPVSEARAERIAISFVAKHHVRVGDYQGPAGHWADASPEVRQFCFQLKKELVSSDARVSPPEAFCVDVEMASGRASFLPTWHEATMRGLAGQWYGELVAARDRNPAAECWLNLMPQDDRQGRFLLALLDRGWAGFEFIDGTFTLDQQEVQLHGVRRFSGMQTREKWGEPIKVLGEIPQELTLRIRVVGQQVRLKANFHHDIDLVKTDQRPPGGEP
jgi:hypothetical protein